MTNLERVNKFFNYWKLLMHFVGFRPDVFLEKSGFPVIRFDNRNIFMFFRSVDDIHVTIELLFNFKTLDPCTAICRDRGYFVDALTLSHKRQGLLLFSDLRILNFVHRVLTII